MKKAKKLFSAALALSLVMASLAGCAPAASTPQSQAPAAESKAEAVSAAAPDEKPVELVWYQFVDKIMPDHDKVMAEVNKYLLEKMNATVKATFLTMDDYQQKMPVIISSGQKFDVCFSTSWMINYNEYVAKGAFLDMTALLDQYAKETKAFVPASYWEGLTVDGKIYGVPGYKEGGHQYGIIYNQDIATEVGIDMSAVKSYKDLTAIFKQLKTAKPEMLGIGNNLYNMALPHEHVSGDWNLPGVLNVPGMNTYKSAGDKVFNQFETPEYMDYAKTVREWYMAGYVPKDPVNYAQVAQDDMKAKKLFAQTIWYAPGCLPNQETLYSCKIGYIPMYNPILETADVTGGSVHCISQNSAHPEKAMEFINLLNTDSKLGTMIRHGIEGANYTVKGDQLDVNGDKANPSYDYGSGWQFGTIFNQTWTTSFPVGVADMYTDFNKTLVPTTGLGFVFNQEKVKTEITAINNVIKEFKEPIEGGAVDPAEYIPKFNEKLKANGLDAYLAEMQSQFDAWKASK